MVGSCVAFFLLPLLAKVLLLLLLLPCSIEIVRKILSHFVAMEEATHKVHELEILVSTIVYLSYLLIISIAIIPISNRHM